MARQRHVVPAPGGGWNVKVPGRSTPASHHQTQGAAHDAARDGLKRSGGGEVIIHRPDGTIRDSDTIAQAKDPFPPKG